MAIELADLERIDASDSAVFGGKALGLARLIRAGARVPRGFAVSATREPPHRWSAAVRHGFCTRLGFLLREGPVAVRSSAPVEDGAERSFAGLFESVLGVTSEATGLAAAARCIASGASERVGAYAGCGALPVAVVVQQLVEAESAGVLFTRDPAGASRGMVIEAVAGLGEALVAGHVTPARWRIHRAGNGVLEAHPEAVSPDGPLSGLAALELGRAAGEIEAALDMPLDLEWARDPQGRTWFVQARPITRAAPPPALPRVDASCPEADDPEVVVWTNVNVRETMPDPLTPLAWSLWRDRVMPGAIGLSLDLPAGDPRARHLVLADRVDGRAYWNVNAMLAVPGLGSLARQVLGVVDGTTLPVLEDLERRGLLVPRRLPFGRGALLAAALRANLKGIPMWLAASRPERSLERFGEITRAVQRRAALPLGPRSDADLADELHEVTSPGFLDVHRLFSSLFVAVGSFSLARHLFRDAPEALRLLGVGLRNNPTTRMSVELDALARRARPLADAFGDGDPEALSAALETTAEGRAWLDQFAGFLAWNGQRGPKEFDLRAPRWSDDPTMLLELVRANLRAVPKESVEARLTRLEAERRRAIAVAVGAAPAWKRPLLRWAARLAERHLPLREGGKHHMLSAIHRARVLAVELGRRLAARGVLGDPDDVFYLDFGELRAAAGGAAAGALQARIAERRAELAACGAGEAPAFVRSDGVPVSGGTRPAGPDGVLRGVGISTGTARGRVRILRTPDPAAFDEGDILVVRLADPGWTPLFPLAGGLVMEVGGLMCHAAVVARELGLPAVFAVDGATTALEDGQQVAVDAEAGTVTPL